MATALPTPGTDSQLRRVAVSSYLGTTIEFYDFILYGTAAALVFNQVFFASLNAALGSVLALATLAIGYVARLGGAVLFGHYGDKLGRKTVMLTTMVTMGVASGLIGLLPSYDQIGFLAPLALVILRILQGVAVGGEFGGAVLMTAEHARPGRRGLASSAAVMGGPSGAILATSAMSLVALLPEDQLLTWGWRIPFLASFALLGVGLYFRLRVPESPVFLKEQSTEQSTDTAPRRLPVVELVRTTPGLLVQAVGLQLGATTAQGIFTIFMVTYAPTVGFSPSVALLALLVTSIGAVAVTPVFAALSDRVGRRSILIYGTVGSALWAYPGFVLINLGDPVVFIAVTAGFVILVVSAVNAVVPVILSELYPTKIRFTGVSISYTLAQTVGSGFAPLIAASLLVLGGGGTNVGYIVAFVILMSVLSLIAIRSLPETRNSELATLAPTAEPSAEASTRVATSGRD